MADLTLANLKGAYFWSVELEGANLYKTVLQEADLIDARDYRFNSTNVRNINFSSVPDDPWSILKQKYTGPAMLWTMLALAA